MKFSTLMTAALLCTGLAATSASAQTLKMLVESDRAVAFAMDDILLFGLRTNSKNPASLEVVGDSLQVEPYACMVRKDDPEFKKLVDDTINA